MQQAQSRVCAPGVLERLNNPKGYAMHVPTMKYDCVDVIETINDDVVDAITLGENLDDFCVEQDLCTRSHRDEF